MNLRGIYMRMSTFLIKALIEDNFEQIYVKKIGRVFVMLNLSEVLRMIRN